MLRDEVSEGAAVTEEREMASVGKAASNATRMIVHDEVFG